MGGPWEQSAEAYGQSFARLCAGSVDQLVSRLGPGDPGRLCLDVGTGPGTAATAARGASFTVVGLDSDESMLGLARRRDPGLMLVRAALPRLPCADESFDAVAANFVINHTPDPRESVREIFRVIRVGGRVAATIWPATPGPLNQLWNEVLAESHIAPLAGLRLPAALDFERTESGFADLFRAAGFDGVECQPTQWTFRIDRDDLWLAVAAGIAVIGQTYRAQDEGGRRRIRASYDALTEARHPGGLLSLPSTALLAWAHRPHRCR